MPTITDSTYYEKGKKFIPNNNNLNTEIVGVPNVSTELEDAISKYERELLIGFLGITLYNELNTALADLPNADVKWQNLVDGTEYVKDGVTYRFDGLSGFDKDSLVAYYVFCKYMENDESYYSTTGIVKSNAQNADSFNPTRKYLDAWSTFLEKYQNEVYSDGYSLLQDRHGNVVGYDYYNQGQNNTLVTLETYLKDHETDFEGYTFKRYEGSNSLGI